MPATVSLRLMQAADEMSGALAALRFAPPVAHVYDPLQYARAPYEAYVSRFGAHRKRVVLLGMNPGPFGMMQTGVPFGEVSAVRDWMGIVEPVQRPVHEHPKRPIEGFACRRSEVSGRRLWGWAGETFGAAEDFFRDWFVLNYCPLVFLGESGRNLTPDKLPLAERAALAAICDEHLARSLQALQPQWAIGVGGFAQRRLQGVVSHNAEAAWARTIQVGQILHPSPASPAANRGWAAAVEDTLRPLGLLPPGHGAAG
ncbi:MAG: single-stranded DNA-binding protein [Rubrivivax sp.]|jgi:single-strand selective monofunctional uracil DNA glycosylase|nr:single-stranded DNA-binding protein [Rubrivivax sp.]